MRWTDTSGRSAFGRHIGSSKELLALYELGQRRERAGVGHAMGKKFVSKVDASFTSPVTDDALYSSYALIVRQQPERARLCSYKEENETSKAQKQAAVECPINKCYS